MGENPELVWPNEADTVFASILTRVSPLGPFADNVLESQGG